MGYNFKGIDFIDLLERNVMKVSHLQGEVSY